ncbi:hypothetical protein DFJ67_6681 [Asanoa ferruginea]|uniref:ABC-type transport system involved in multi-copper enzyme maturation permease subunit n=1 Tax=Asanoa ferruginea TaxID=53367 RepID=A0A3D9ZTX8_9ACTN|nr:hypothetical protein [Asanoa ferruginea]REG00626.1 hypothetical protein DFJ67_6681 [Asanoa ferruginea]GIF47789.1 ABC transporter [Asanoa ferruginea]
MTAVVEAPPTVTPVGAVASRRRATLALARVEAVRMLRHPVTVAAFLLYLGPWAWILFRPGADRYPVLHTTVVSLQMAAMLVLGGAALVVANLATLRERRHRTDAVSDLLILPPAWRTTAFLLAVLALAGLALLVLVAQVTLLALLPGRAGVVVVFDVAIPAGIVAVLGAAGVLLALLVRSPIVAPLAAVAFAAAGFVSIASVATGAAWGRLLPMLPDEVPFALPAALVDRPSGRHLAYLGGLALVLTALALLRSGARARVGVPLLAGALAVTVAAGIAQFDRDERVQAARVAANADPSTLETCQVRTGVTYCAFSDFTSWIPAWAEVVGDVSALVPAAATTAGPPLAVRQRVWADGYQANGVFGPADEDATGQAQQASDAAAGTPEAVPVGTKWGDDESAAVLAASVAYRFVTGRTVSGRASACGGQAALVVWLAGQASPRTAAGVRALDDHSFGALAFADPSLRTWLSVDDRDAALGLTLLARPAAEVAPVVSAHWSELTAPETSLEAAAALFNVPALPAPEQGASTRCEG